MFSGLLSLRKASVLFRVSLFDSCTPHAGVNASYDVALLIGCLSAGWAELQETAVPAARWDRTSPEDQDMLGE